MSHSRVGGRHVFDRLAKALLSLSALLFVLSCQKLSYKPSEVPVTFEGIRSIVATKPGTYIVSWDEPQNAKDLVDSYEIYIAGINSSPVAKLAEEPPIQSGSSGTELDGMIVNMAEQDTPAVLGKVLAVVRGENNYTITGLTSGNYGIQVKAVGKNGLRDANRRVSLISVVLSVQFQGIWKAEYDASKASVKLSWRPYESKIKGEPIYYAVYEGETFAESDRIAYVTADPVTGIVPTSYVVSVKKKEPGTKVSYGVRVKDPLGKFDTNVNTLSITIPKFAAEDICLSAESVSSVKTRVHFKFPVDADRVIIYRNGYEVTQITDQNRKSFDDFPLTEGTKYEYSCEARRFGYVVPGKQVFSAITESSLAPTFNGVTNAYYDRATQKMMVFWDGSSGVPADYYQVFVTPGPVVRWSEKPFLVAKDTDRRVVIDSLGDEFTYSIGVRACSIHNFCDTNIKQAADTVAQRGAPNSKGISSVELVPISKDGPKFVVTADWDQTVGYVATRKIYFHSAPIVATEADLPECKSSILSPWQYVSSKSAYRRCLQQGGFWSWQAADRPAQLGFFSSRSTAVPDKDKYNPPTTLELTGIVQNSMYTLFVLDADAEGNESVFNGETKVLQITTPDFSPPSFGGITALELGPKEFALRELDDDGQQVVVDLRDTALVARFNAPEASEGVSHYQVYMQEVSGQANVACPNPTDTVDRSKLEQGALYAEIAINDNDESDGKEIRFLRANGAAAPLHIPGSQAAIMIRGLKERTDYVVCLRARDANKNVSITTAALRRSTIDIKAPVFDGVQSISYDAKSQSLQVNWSASPSKDMLYYKLDIWGFDRNTKPDARPSYPSDSTQPETHRVVIANHPASSMLVTNRMADIKSNHSIYVIVNACDSGASIQGGQQNCTAFPVSSAKLFNVDDIEPPPFDGILTTGHEQTRVSKTEVEVTVKWKAPNDWSDFKGFIVYDVSVGSGDPILTKLKDCPAKDSSGNNLTSCTVEGLSPFREYLLHVRAYDKVTPEPNISILDPVQYSARIVTIDQDKPDFRPNLDGIYSVDDGGIVLTWSPATDNQFAGNPNSVIRYEVYRKDGAPAGVLPVFDEPNMNKVTTTLQPTFTDMGSHIKGGRTYSYVVCAVDGTYAETQDPQNRNCQPGKAIIVDDLTPPTITEVKIVNVGTTTVKSPSSKAWDVLVSVSDNKTPADQLRIELCLGTSSLQQGPQNLDEKTCNGQFEIPATPKSSDPSSPDNLVGTVRFNGMEARGLGGPPSADVYVNYLVRVTELLPGRPFVTFRTFSVESRNRLTVTEIKSTEGKTAGGELLFIKGTGFNSAAVVKLGGTSCQSLTMISDSMLTCIAPSTTQAGPVNVQAVVSNPNERGQTRESISSETGAPIYNYCTGSDCVNICNKPTSAWNQSPRRFAGGVGTSADPWILCTADHLRQIQSTPDPSGSVPFYKLGANIDLAGVVMNPIGNRPATGTATQARLIFNGDNYVISNYRHENTNREQFGLFASFNDATVGYAENLRVLNVNIKGNQRIGGLTGYASDGRMFKNLLVTGKVEGNWHVGGIIGESYAQLEDAEVSNIEVIGSSTHVGGLVGYQRWRASGSLKGSGVVQGNWENIGGLFGTYLGGGTISDARFEGIVRVNPAQTNWGINGTGGLIGSLELYSGVTVNLRNPVVNATVLGRRTSGGVVGRSWNSGNLIIDGAKFSGTVTAGDYTGGLAGWVAPGTANISNALVEGRVNGSSYTGGLIGDFSGSCTDYYGSGNAGANPSVLLTDSIVSADISSGWIERIGGAIGSTTCSKVKNVNASGSVTVNRATNADSYHIGGFVGYLESVVIEDSRASGKVVATNHNTRHIGGFFGSLSQGWTMISNCQALGDVVAGAYFVGGFGGYSRLGFKPGNSSVSKIINSRAAGNVTSLQTASAIGWGAWVGGFIGYIDNRLVGRSGSIPVALCNTAESFGNGCSMWGQYERNRATGNVRVDFAGYAGGFVGGISSSGEEGCSARANNSSGQLVCTAWTAWNNGNGPRDELVLLQNYATGSVDANRNVGGFVGNIDPNAKQLIIRQNYATGNVNASQNTAGGFIGDYPVGSSTRIINVVISDNYSRGNVKALSSAGGFADVLGLVVQRAYSTGTVEATSTGGFHRNNPAQGSVANGGLGALPSTYWDKTVAGNIASHNFGAVGKTTSELKNQATFVGFDFDSIWKMPDDGGYPIFKWQQ